MSDRRKVLELFKEQEAFWKERASYGIERYRKGDVKIVITDLNGKPIQNAKVTASQKSHEFRFGANLFMLDELETPEKIHASQGNMTLGENYYYGGLLRFDLTPKPAYNRIKELIQKKWHTETELTTNENGVISYRGFFVKYDLCITVDGKTVNRSVEISSSSENNISIALTEI